MPALNVRVLLAVSVLLLAACAPNSVKESASDPRPLHDIIAPQPSTPAATAESKPSDGPTTAAVQPPSRSASPASSYPFVLSFESSTFEVHQPIVDSWNDGILTGRAVVLAHSTSAAQPLPGSVTIKAIGEVDSVAGIVSLVDTEVLGVSFPAGVDQTQAWHEFLRFAVPPKITALPVSSLHTGRSIAAARENAAAVPVIPPRILVSERPAVLVYIDGDPRYVPLKGTNLAGVLNTRVLLLKDGEGNYYLHLYDGWITARSLDGPWAISSSPPDAPGLEDAARASGRINLLIGKADGNGHRPVLAADHLPDIVITLKPTALIVLDGAPRYASVAGTGLQHAVNTSAPLFKDSTSGDVYAQVDGSWFRAGDVSGPWSHVATANLPADFSAIPGERRDPNPGVVAVDRSTATLYVNLDGDPVLEPIRGTQLNYVANASVPVIQIDINNWYAVQNGVWFYSTQATGPWSVTDRVPPEIYSIPPGVPIYHAIHSRVMASSTDVTYYGYAGAGSHVGGGGAIGVEESGGDYQYTPPSGMYWGWVY
jgi:hypothetical protein